MRVLLCFFVGMLGLGCSCDDDSAATAGPDASVDGSGGVDGGGGAAGAPTDGASDANGVNVVDGSATAQCGPTEWSVRFGGSSPDSSLAEESARAISVSPGGEIFVTGYYRGDADFGGGPLVAGGSNPSMFILELDSSGQHVWSDGFGDPSQGLFFSPQARGTALARGADGSVFVAGSFAGIVDFGGGALASTSEMSGGLADAGLEDAGLGDAGFGGCLLACEPDAVVVKLDATRTHRWSKRYGGQEGDAASDIAIDSAGNVLVTGVFRGSADFEGTSLVAEGVDKRDVFLLKLDPDGNVVRAVDYGGAEDDTAAAIATHGTDVIVVGSFTGSIDFGRGAIQSSGTEFQAFVAKLDENGQELWSRSLPSSFRSTATGVATDSAGNIVVVGVFRGDLNLGSEPFVGAYDDAFVVKLDSSGNVLWAHAYGGYRGDGASSVAIGPNDEVTIVGWASNDTVDFGGGGLRGGTSDDLFAVTLDAQGTHLCSRRYAASDGSSAAHGVAIDAAGRLLVAGSFNRTVDFGKGPLTSTGGSDAVVLALDGAR